MTPLTVSPSAAAPIPAPRTSLSVVLFARLAYIVTRIGLPPLVLAHVGLAEYGLWAACFVLVAWTGLGPIGVGMLTVRGVAEAAARGDVRAMGQRMAEATVLIAGLAATVLGAIALAAPWLLVVFKVEPHLRDTATHVFVGTCAIVLLEACLAAPSLALQGLRRTTEEQISWVAGFVVEAVLIVALLLGGAGLSGLLLAFAIRSLVTTAMATWQLRQLLPQLRLQLVPGWTQRCSDLLRQALALQLSQVAAIVLQSMDRVVAGLSLGPVATAVMDLGGKFSSTTGAVAAAVCGNVTAHSAHHHATGDKRALAGAVREGLAQTAGLLALLCPPLVFLAGPLLGAWLGSSADLATIAPVMMASSLAAHLVLMTGPVNAALRASGDLMPEIGFHLLRFVLALAGLGSALALWALDAGTLAVGLAAGTALAAAIYLPLAHARIGLAPAAWLKVCAPASLSGYVSAALGAIVVSRVWNLPLSDVTAWSEMGRIESLQALLLGGLVHALALASLAWFWLLNGATRARLVAAIGIAALVTGCATVIDPVGNAYSADKFKPAQKSDVASFVAPELLVELEAPADPVYRLGAGDIVQLQAWARPELSGKHTLGPDGRITVPLAGPLRLGGHTRESAAGEILGKLDAYYQALALSISVEQYTANRITVLGRVQNPGAIAFDHPPTLLEALAKAGSLPVIDKQATLTRCAVIRGRERVIWVDLKRLLNQGDIRYNLRLQAGDLVYIPDSDDTLIYVMGAVQRPGTYRLTPDMSLNDALMKAGGPSEDAVTEQITLYRPGSQVSQLAPLSQLITGAKRVNFSLEEGDVIYVPASGLSRVGYAMRQLLPGLSFFTSTAALAKASEK
jgi:polysaccharide biosynthesis/export protein